MHLPPLLLAPRFKPRPWGGRNLARLYGKALPPNTRIGESWEVSDRPGDVSQIPSGPLAGRDLRWLLEHHPRALLGTAEAPNGRFPLLVKILDAEEVLSVQVHPPAALAAALGGEPKTELWYVTHAAPDATLHAGLRRHVTRKEFEEGLRQGTVADCIHRVPVRPGDALFLPSGRLHALGANVVIFEIQENSDTTYRLFDWNRLGPDGQPRELHVEPALACVNFEDFEPGVLTAPWNPEGPLQRRDLLSHDRFSVVEFRAPATASRTWSEDRPAVLGLIEGALTLDHPPTGESLVLRPGQFSLLPAASSPVQILAQAGSAWLLAHPGPLRPEPA